MSYRKTALVEGATYHIFTKSISEFRIFNSDADFGRILETMQFYTAAEPPSKFSVYLEHKQKVQSQPFQLNSVERIVRLLAYCIMPTHIHLIIQQLKGNGISKFINLILKSYTRYFNLKHNRKGPLWEARFKNVLVETDEQYLHLTRYIHLNPATAYLVSNPEEWRFSSYREYTGLVKEDEKLCNFSDYFDMNTETYKKFVEDRIDYQRKLGKIKHLILE